MALVSVLSFVVGLIVIGVVAGFSIILYATQMALLGDAKAPIKKGVIQIAGIATGLVLLAVFFFLVRPETFHISSVWEVLEGYRLNVVDILVGLASLGGGIYIMLLGHRRTVKPAPVPHASVHTKARLGNAAVFSLGFVRAITQVTGVAALLLGVRTVVHTTDSWILQIVSTALLLIAALLPYGAMVAARLWHPRLFAHLEHYLTKIKSFRPYRTAGVLLVLIGLLFLVLAFVTVS